MGHPAIEPLGDSALIVRLGSERLGSHIDELTRRRVGSAAAALGAAAIAGVVDIVPAFTTITVHWHLNQTRFADVAPRVAAALSAASATHVAEDRLIRIPVCYGGAFGPDLEAVAAHVGITAVDVAHRHAAQEYRVSMMGFLPGFAYLGGLDPGLAVPRHAAPRERVPAGSVGIAGLQTGVYPLDSPGGWQLIGRSPCRLFDPLRKLPALLRAGDRVRFDAIAPEAFGTAEVVIS